MVHSGPDKKEQAHKAPTQAIEASTRLHYLSSLKKHRPRPRPNSLAGIFSNIRIDRHLSCEDLAIKFHLSLKYVTQIHNGQTFGSLAFFLKCAELFDANPNWVKIKWANESSGLSHNRLLHRLGLNN